MSRSPVRLLAAPFVLAAAALAAPARAGEVPGEVPDLAARLDALAPTVVTVKFVAKTRLSMGGQQQDDESNVEVRGVVVDATGIAMVSNASLEGGLGMLRRRMRGVDVSSTPTDFKVLLGNDPKEHDAVLLARDSTLGLAFVQMLSVEGVALQAARLAPPARPPQVGQALFGVSRLGRGFDFAPVVGTLAVTGKVEKPRAMWSVGGSFSQTGLPVYDAAGQAVGVLSLQEGAEGASSGGGHFMGMSLADGPGTFLLPLDAVGRVVEAAKKRAPEALAKAREAQKPAADEPATPEAGAPAAPPKAPEPTPPEKPKDE